jgi:CheY-like chemotaxis protein
MANETILVIEDNELNMKLVRSLLTMGKYSILEAKDAESGIRLAREHNPELILMDLQLPRMDGLSATKILKADPALQKIPIVALTSHAMEGDDKRAMSAGCNGYMPKPIDTKNFLATIQQYLQG